MSRGYIIKCTKCNEVVKSVFVDDMDDPITNVFYCDSHGLLISPIEVTKV